MIHLRFLALAAWGLLALSVAVLGLPAGSQGAPPAAVPPPAALPLPPAVAAPPAATPLPAAAAQPAAATQPAATRPALEPYTVTRGVFRIDLEWAGVFESVKSAELAFPGEALPQIRVLKAAEAGQKVTKGQAVLWLDPADARKTVQAREVALGQADTALRQGQEDLAYLEKTTADQLAQADLAAKRAQEDLDRWVKIDQPMDEKTSRQTLKNAADHLAYVQEELRQLKKMYAADDVIEETEEIVLRRQKDAVDAATFYLEKTKTEQDRHVTVDLPRSLYAVTLTKDQKARDLLYAKAVLPLALKKKQLDLDKLKQDQAKAAEDLDKARKDLTATTLVSPMDGVVYYGKCAQGRWPALDAAAAKLAPGAMVKGEDVLITIVDPRAMSIRVAVPEKDLQALQAHLAGQAAPTSRADQKLAVSLESFSTVPQAAGFFDAKLSLAQPPPAGLMPGMTCTVRLTAGETKDVIVIPSGYLAADPAAPGGTCVWVRKDAGPQKRTVKTGRSYAGKTEIVEGLSGGETLLPKAQD